MRRSAVCVSALLLTFMAADMGAQSARQRFNLGRVRPRRLNVAPRPVCEHAASLGLRGAAEMGRDISGFYYCSGRDEERVGRYTFLLTSSLGDVQDVLIGLYYVPRGNRDDDEIRDRIFRTYLRATLESLHLQPTNEVERCLLPGSGCSDTVSITGASVSFQSGRSGDQYSYVASIVLSCGSEDHPCPD